MAQPISVRVEAEIERTAVVEKQGPSNQATAAGHRRLLRWSESRIGLQRHESDDLQHARLEKRQRFHRRPGLRLVFSFPNDRRSRHIGACPDLAKQSGGVQFFHASSLSPNKLWGEGFRWKCVGAAAGETEKLHEQIVKDH